ncbi:MAG TPA: hypothetical protein VD771_07230 [Gemmatimonadaceae bacterium]|nr:hypothetical protein [Gemmatimonadaceae bacterium]
MYSLARATSLVEISRRALGIAAVVPAMLIVATVGLAQGRSPSPFLSDRGDGIATSMFGDYVRSGELKFYPFYEYTSGNLEYKPAELGFGLDQDFRGAFREHEAMVFIGYGVSNRLALEVESALFTSARLRKDPSDPSAMPAVLRESGFGDTQVEGRYRWIRESLSRPEIFSYLEVDFPFQRGKKIIGTQTWAYKLGTGAIKGFSFGTLTLRAAGEYDEAEKKVVFGEYALEYLKRLSTDWRVYSGIEGDQDEVELIVEAQRRLGSRATLKLNSGFGLTSKAPDFAPEVGVMFRF